MFQNFLIKKMLRAQGVPPEQADMLMNLVSKNPALFKQIGEEIQVLTKQGKDQQAAAMEVMMRHQDELKKLVQ